MVAILVPRHASRQPACDGATYTSLAFWSVGVVVWLLLLLVWSVVRVVGVWLLLVRRVAWIVGVWLLLVLVVATLLLLLIGMFGGTSIAAGILWWRGAVVAAVALWVAGVIGAVLAARLAVLEKR